MMMSVTETAGLGLRKTKFSGPVECLGETFESDDVRREHYLALLAEKLKDPEFRAMPGFPKGTDEAILKMSDPPYYTACPNPFLEDFVRVHGRPYDPDEKYHREPFAVDVMCWQDRCALQSPRLPYQGSALGYRAVDSSLHQAGRYRPRRVLRIGDDRSGGSVVQDSAS